MGNLFEEIAESCNHKQVASICKKLEKKLSFKNGKDVENLCDLTYWLYILGEKELAKKCIGLTHGVEFDSNYNVWDFINPMWGLEIRILREEGKNADADEIAKAIDKNYLTPSKTFKTPEDKQKHEDKRRSRFGLGTEFSIDVSYQKKVEDFMADGDNKGANDWRFVALASLIGDTETGLYPNLNKDKEKIEEVIKNYIGEITK